jgi:ribosome-binding protein aMBF1 (putative translation factor)
MSENWKRIVRPATAEERARHAEIREKVVQEFPPLEPPRLLPVTNSIGAQIRQAREAQGFTRFALAKKAGIANSSTVRDIEYGRDARLSDVETVAAALGLELTLVEPVGQRR